jgi:hypothetical protein
MAFFLSSVFTIMVPIAHAEQLISIVPGASDSSRARFLDITFYPLKTGSQLGWFNDDNIDHRLIVNMENGAQIADSGIIKSGSSFSYKFEKPGIYRFSSPAYPWMHGNVLVTDDISTVTTSHLKNNVDVQLSWSPSKPEVGQMTNFVITFVNTKTHRNQDHVDYSFAINDLTGKTLYSTGFSRHSGAGVEPVSYTFRNPGNFISTITIYGILFQPVNPDQANFTLGTR